MSTLKNYSINIFGSFTGYILGLLLLVGIAGTLAYKFPLLRYFFEKDGPRIELLTPLEGFGTSPQELHFKVTDEKSGIELIRVRVDQSRLNKEIFKLNVPLNTDSQEITLPIDGRKEGFKPGNIRITIEAFDRSLKSNGEKIALDAPVRFDVPEIELLTTQHNTVQGGMEFVIYRVQADKVKQSGVRVGNKEFVGFPLYLLDRDFESIKGLFFSFYVVPFVQKDRADQKESAPVIYARNSVGNETTQGFYYRLQSQRQRSWKYEVEDLTLTRFAQGSIGDYLSKLQLTESRYWSEKLIKPAGSQLSPGVGDFLEVTDANGKQIRLQNDLITFRNPTTKNIIANCIGKVVALVEGEGFKKVVVIDHGFGLTSVFSNLDEVTLQKNQEVGPQDNIGRGSSLAQSGDGGYEYGLFYQGVPTRPIEWWDQNWVREHVLKKISDAKKLLGVNAPLAQEGSNADPENEILRPVIRSLNDIDKSSSVVDIDQRDVSRRNSEIGGSTVKSDRDTIEDYERGRDF